MDHAFRCPKSALPSIRHYHIRDITADLLTDMCSCVGLEPTFQPLTGERFFLHSINTEEWATLGIADRGVPTLMSESSTPLPLPTSYHPPVPHTNHRHKREKRRAYEQRILQMEHGIFTPLILSTGTLRRSCLQETGQPNCHQARTR